MDNKHNSLNLAAKICSDICPRTLSVPRCEQFSESENITKVHPGVVVAEQGTYLQIISLRSG